MKKYIFVASALCFLGAGCTIPSELYIPSRVPSPAPVVPVSQGATPLPVEPVTAPVVSKLPVAQPVSVPVVETKPAVTPVVAPKPAEVPAPKMHTDWTTYTHNAFTIQLPPGWQGNSSRFFSSTDSLQYIQYGVFDLDQAGPVFKSWYLSGRALDVEKDGVAHRCGDGSGCPTMTAHENVTIGGASGLHWTLVMPDGTQEEWYMLIRGNTGYRFWGVGKVAAEGTVNEVVKTLIVK